MLETTALSMLFILVYHHFLYPGFIVWLAKIRKAKPNPDSIHWSPSVSLLIAAYNEEAVIQEKLNNSCELDYPNLLEIIVIADGSTDATPRIVADNPDKRVALLFDEARRGKCSALNRGVEVSKGDIVVFSDANNEFSANAIRELVKHFEDSTVGGVTGAKKIRIESERQASVGDNLYWHYESVIKAAESDVLSITGSDGEIFAMRRALFHELDHSVINDDLELTLDLVYNGYKVLYEANAKSYESASLSIRDDFWVKVRIVAGGFQALSRHWRRIFNVTNPFSIMFISHKVIRWIVPELLIVLLVLSALLINYLVFKVLLVLQLLFYGLAIVGWGAVGKFRLPLIVYVPFYFTAMNLAALFGLFRFLSKSQGVNWRKAAR